MNSDWHEYERRLRKILHVPENAGVEEILAAIRAEEWQPNLCCQEVDGIQLWTCPIRTGIWTSAQSDTKTGVLGELGASSPAVAALEGLLQARGVPSYRHPIRPALIPTDAIGGSE